jgi:hypothetical protein
MINECNVKTYAPVIIPTLCRYEHFKNCVESLARCTWAEKTDVYIGLDYPAKESHWEGYRKIKDYLKNARFNFKSLVVVERDRNYGFGPSGNLSSLRKYVFEHYDRIIETEDDNVFSPCFLEYINKGLTLFEKDKSVLAINGYKHDYPIKMDENTFFKQNVNYSAWGEGYWRDRMEKLPGPDYFRKMFSIKKFFKMKKEIGGNRAYDFWRLFFYPKFEWRDSLLSVYAYLENMNVVMPSKKSLVRNMGWDASGEHCVGPGELRNKHLNQMISDEKDFFFNGNGFEYYEENRAIIKENSYARISEFVFWKRFCKNFVRYAMYKMLRK